MKKRDFVSLNKLVINLSTKVFISLTLFKKNIYIYIYLFTSKYFLHKFEKKLLTHPFANISRNKNGENFSQKI